jgi:hypothetical protein
VGVSYGGGSYMMYWIAGNRPDRVDCLVQHHALFDLRSVHYSTEESLFPRRDFDIFYSEARKASPPCRNAVSPRSGSSFRTRTGCWVRGTRCSGTKRFASRGSQAE